MRIVGITIAALLVGGPLHAQTLGVPFGSLPGQYPLPGFYATTLPPGVVGAAAGGALDPANDYIDITRYSATPNGTYVTGSSISVQQLLLAVPQGATGPQGAAGPQGPAGPQGAPGAPGISVDQLIALSSRIDRLRSRFDEGIALAGAVNVLVPNPGDRFAVSFGGAGYGGSGAGSVAVSARLT